MRRHVSFLAALALLTFALFTGLSPASAQPGQTYYVATNGSDANPGTEALPFLTISKGASVLNPGDTLLVKQGIYREELNNVIPSGASWLQPITLRAYPGHQVTIQPDQGAQRVITISGNRHYIIIDGFILDGTNVSIDGIKIAGDMNPRSPNPSHIRIINNEIRNVGATKTASQGYIAYGNGILTTGLSNHVEYIGNRIHNNGLTDYDHGIYHTASYALIEGNIIYNNKGSGIKVGWGQNARDNIVRNNLIYDNNAAQGANGQKKQGRGIGVYFGSGTQVYNNVIWGAHLAAIDVTYGGHNARIYNNTIISVSGYGIIVGYGPHPAGTTRNTVVENNLVYQLGDDPAIYSMNGLNAVFQHNLTYGQNPAILADNPASAVLRNNLENVDPAFINLAARDFNLQGNSPAIDAGSNANCPETDPLGHFRTFDGNGDGQPQCDVGAFEYNGFDHPSAEGAQPYRNTFMTDSPTLTWSRLDWATRYQIEIDNTPDFRSVNYVFDSPDAGLSLQVGPLQAGVFYWRIRGQRPDGSWGNWSQPETFLVRPA